MTTFGLPDRVDLSGAGSYLPITREDTELRVRRKGDETVLTVKRGRGLDRGEQEVAISAEVFETLWPLTEGAPNREDALRAPARRRDD
jgi:adenylate cyclase